MQTGMGNDTTLCTSCTSCSTALVSTRCGCVRPCQRSSSAHCIRMAGSCELPACAIQHLDDRFGPGRH
eukprot:4297395-Alexandrium_andersonii.AAC.1